MKRVAIVIEKQDDLETEPRTKTVLDHDTRTILESNKYDNDDLATLGFDKLVECVQTDYQRLYDWQEGKWKYQSITAVATIETSMDGKRWVSNTIRGITKSGVESDNVVVQRVNNLHAFTSLFEILRLLGFSRNEIIAAMPKKEQPAFRGEIAKIKYQNAKIYQ